MATLAAVFNRRIRRRVRARWSTIVVHGAAAFDRTSRHRGRFVDGTVSFPARRGLVLRIHRRGVWQGIFMVGIDQIARCRCARRPLARVRFLFPAQHVLDQHERRCKDHCEARAEDDFALRRLAQLVFATNRAVAVELDTFGHETHRSFRTLTQPYAGLAARDQSEISKFAGEFRPSDQTPSVSPAR